MALLLPVPGSRLSQGYGPSPLAVEPEMYANAQRAYWQPYPGLTYFRDFHAALDFSADLGTPILASETGKVVYAGWRSNGGGLCMQVEIRENVRYEHSHCSSVLTPVGRIVERGEVIARVGATGTVTGNHTHFSLTIREVVEGLARTFIWNPALFLPGGSLENDPRIRPVVDPPVDQLPDTSEVAEMGFLKDVVSTDGRYFDVKAGVNLRKGPGTQYPLHFTTKLPERYWLHGFHTNGWVFATRKPGSTGFFFVPPVH